MTPIRNKLNMLPDKISLQGESWSIAIIAGLFNDIGQEIYGQCSSNTHLISINSLPPYECDGPTVANTIVHELLHAVIAPVSGSDIILNNEQEEVLVTAITDRLMSLLFDNPQLIEAISNIYASAGTLDDEILGT